MPNLKKNPCDTKLSLNLLNEERLHYTLGYRFIDVCFRQVRLTQIVHRVIATQDMSPPIDKNYERI